MKNLLVKIGWSVLLAVVAATAWAAEPAATLQQIQGGVFVDQRGAMVPAWSGMPIHVGDRVATADDGAVLVVYQDRCALPLGAGTLLAVRDRPSPCSVGTAAEKRNIEGFWRGVIGQVAPPPSSDANSGPIADVKRPQGSVLVHQGTSEQPAQQNMDLRRDDEIITDKNSKATVVFRGCEVEVGPQEQVTVSELQTRCKEGVFLASGADLESEIAILKQAQGSVMVDQGMARKDMGLHGGNRIITGAGSKVTVAFRGCEAVVDEKEQVKVGDLVARCLCGFQVKEGVNDSIADLKRPQGNVLIEQGTAQRSAQHNMDVRDDDEIVTDKESRVTVAFRGCEVEVGPQEQVTVGQLRAKCRDGFFGGSDSKRDEETDSVEIAIIKQPKGSVMVDEVIARKDMGVHRDNRITTGAGSRVTVVFRACEAAVGEEQRAKVRDLATACKCGLWADAGAGSAGGGAGTSGVGVALNPGPLLIGGGFVGSVGGAILQDGADVSPP